jgi:hypothetical protein
MPTAYPQFSYEESPGRWRLEGYELAFVGDAATLRLIPLTYVHEHYSGMTQLITEFSVNLNIESRYFKSEIPAELDSRNLVEFRDRIAELLSGTIDNVALNFDQIQIQLRIFRNPRLNREYLLSCCINDPPTFKSGDIESIGEERFGGSLLVLMRLSGEFLSPAIAQIDAILRAVGGTP